MAGVIIYVTDGDGQEEAGRITLQGNQLMVQAAPDKHQLMETVSEEAVLVNGTLIHAMDNPRLWLKRLPYLYTGWKVRAAYID